MPLIRMLHLVVMVFMCFLTVGCGDNNESTERVNLDGHDSETFEVLGVEQEFPLTQYLKLNVRENGEQREVMFNTEESTIEADDLESQLTIPYKITDNQKGIITARPDY